MPQGRETSFGALAGTLERAAYLREAEHPPVNSSERLG